MRNDWVAAPEVERRLRREAEAVALRLGHRIEAWNNRDQGDRLVALCLNCLERLWIAPRRFGELAMHGVPVTLACRPRRGR